MLHPSKITRQKSDFSVTNMQKVRLNNLAFNTSDSFFHAYLQAVTDLLNNESVSDIDRLRLVMLYALRYEKENPVQLMQLFNKLASRSPKYKPGVK